MVKAKFTTDEVNNAIREFSKKLKAKGLKVDRVILYGSYAYGNPRDFSDIDLAIISPSFHGKDRLTIQGMIANAVAGRSGLTIAIEPIGYSSEEYKKVDRATFLGEIKRTGRVIKI